MSPEAKQCCFCGKRITETSQEPIQIMMAFADDSSQAMWSHIDCLGARLHRSVPWLSLKEREELEE